MSPHTPRHHVTSTHLCGGDMWHQKNNTLLKERVTMTTWQRCDYTPCVTPDTDHLKRKASWKENRKNHDSAGAKKKAITRTAATKISETPDHLWLHPMCIPDTDHLNGNLLLNKENWENLMSAGKLPETDSRMKTLKYCVTHLTTLWLHPMCYTRNWRRHWNTVSHTTGLLQITYCGNFKAIGIVEKLEKNRPYHWIERKQ